MMRLKICLRQNYGTGIYRRRSTLDGVPMYVFILFWNEFWVWDLRVVLDNRTNSTVI